MKNYGLPKSERIYLKEDFKNIFSTGKKVQIKGFTFWCKPNLGEASKPQIGIIVSKKLGSAVERNRCKRLLREAFRLNKHLLKNAAILIYPKEKEMLPSLQAATKALLALAEKAGIKEECKGPNIP